MIVNETSCVKVRAYFKDLQKWSNVIMVEPSGESGSDQVWLYLRCVGSMMLPRFIAEQLRDALIKVCDKPKVE